MDPVHQESHDKEASRTGRAIEDRLADFTTDRRVLLLSAMALIVGAVAALVAYVLVWLIGVITNACYYLRFSPKLVSPLHSPLGAVAILIPIAGGLIIGLMARYGSEKIRGHGIPEALEAILIGRSQLGPRVAILKPISSAISIGMGGPFGAEGPIIMTGGAFGSLFAQFFNLSSAERKTLLVAGAAAGMSAIFATPVAAVLLAVELLLFEWKPRSFIPVTCAAAVAAALRVPLLGAGPIFGIPAHAVLGGEGLLVALVVGIIAGVGSGILTNMVYGFEDAFMKLPIHWMWWPAIGGFFIGIGGLVDPRVLGVGYDTIYALMQGKILGMTLIGLLVGKALVWSIALGSGTSGGVLAPLLLMGGALGALEAHWIHIGTPGVWVLISMAAMMGGTMRSPFTAVVFTLELTHDINLLPALLIGCVASEAVTVLALRRSILTEKVARRGHHLIREYTVDPFDIHRIREIMETNPPTVPPTMKVSEFVDWAVRAERRLARRSGAPIVDESGRLMGVVTQGDVLRSLEEQPGPETTVLDAGTKQLITITQDEVVRDAAIKMLRHEIGRLPVVDEKDSARLVGILTRSQMMAARMRWYEDEHVRGRRWSVPLRRIRV